MSSPPSTSTTPPFSLTTHLLTTHPAAFHAATHAPFLTLASTGHLPKPILSQWLANDRLYIHAYLRALGRVLARIDLPQSTSPEVAARSSEGRFVDWLCATLGALRTEEKLFLDIGRRYGLELELVHGAQREGEGGKVRDEVKSRGLVMFEKLYGSVCPAQTAHSTDDVDVVPAWMDAAVVMWGTERVYNDAWTLVAKSEGQSGATAAMRKPEDDLDGGALRKELIPNWSNPAFAATVVDVGEILDSAAREIITKHGEEGKKELIRRATEKWQDLLAAETAFWPEVGEVEM